MEGSASPYDVRVTSLPDSPFLAACRSEPHDVTPVWFMRQAGRSLPEYREIRGEGSINEAIANPDLATEITLQPIRRYGVDAAILFSDIVTPVHAIDFGMDVVPGVGPVAERPFRSSDDLERLRPFDAEADTPYVLETIDNLVAELDIPLIGFAGAPFTVASYLIEGRPSRTYHHTKVMMKSRPQLWFALMDRLADMAIASLESQVAHGAEAIQLFDSWAGALSAADYERYAMPSSARVFEAIGATGVPRIHFGVGTGELLPLMAEAGADVIGVDWRIPLAEARTRVPADRALQGNLDPAILGAPWEVVAAEVDAVLDSNAGHPGHIFNLGHGVTPDSDPDTLELVVDRVHAYRA